MKTAEEILKSKLDGKITFVNNPDYTFNKVIEAMEEYRLQSHPSPMSAEQVEELADKYASEEFDKHSFSEFKGAENSLWENRKADFIAGYNAATTPSVKADGLETVKVLWSTLTDEQRLELACCKGCGSLDTSCQCLNDE
jgi:hypothetical protein